MPGFLNKPGRSGVGVLTASMTSGKSSMVKRPLSSLRPPWFEMTMPSRPA